MPGMLKFAAQERGTIFWILIRKVSPGSAPLMKIGPVSDMGPRPGQSVRSFFNSSIVLPGQSRPWECDMVSTTTVSPESITKRGNSALSNHPHWVASNVAGRMNTRPGYLEAGTAINFCAPEIADGGCCANEIPPSNVAIETARARTRLNCCIAPPLTDAAAIITPRDETIHSQLPRM